MFDGDARARSRRLPGMRERTVTISSRARRSASPAGRSAGPAPRPALDPAVRAVHQFIDLRRGDALPARRRGRPWPRPDEYFDAARARTTAGAARPAVRRARRGRLRRLPAGGDLLRPRRHPPAGLRGRRGVLPRPAGALRRRRDPGAARSTADGGRRATSCASPSARTTRRSTKACGGCSGSGPDQVQHRPQRLVPGVALVVDALEEEARGRRGELGRPVGRLPQAALGVRQAHPAPRRPRPSPRPRAAPSSRGSASPATRNEEVAGLGHLHPLDLHAGRALARLRVRERPEVVHPLEEPPGVAHRVRRRAGRAPTTRRACRKRCAAARSGRGSSAPPRSAGRGTRGSPSSTERTLMSAGSSSLRARRRVSGGVPRLEVEVRHLVQGVDAGVGAARAVALEVAAARRPAAPPRGGPPARCARSSAPASRGSACRRTRGRGGSGPSRPHASFGRARRQDAAPRAMVTADEGRCGPPGGQARRALLLRPGPARPPGPAPGPGRAVPTPSAGPAGARGCAARPPPCGWAGWSAPSPP